MLGREDGRAKAGEVRVNVSVGLRVRVNSHFALASFAGHPAVFRPTIFRPIVTAFNPPSPYCPSPYLFLLLNVKGPRLS